MKDVLVFKNVQDMSNEADEFLAKITDADIKACAKLLMMSCYAYINEFIGDASKKTYNNLATLIKYEMLSSEYNAEGHSKMYVMIQNAPDRSIAKKAYRLYYNCCDELKKRTQMHLMNLLLINYLK